MIGTINKVTLCLLATRIEASSELKTDSMEILRLLNSTITAMDQLQACYDAVYQATRKIEEKKKCLAILSKLQSKTTSRQSVSRRRNRFRHKRRPLMSFQGPCSGFHPRGTKC